MATPISKFASGLLDLVGTKAQGQNPSEMSGLVSLHLDGLYPFTVQRMVADAAAPFAMPGGSPSVWASHTVPTGEAWIVYAYAELVQVAIGEAFGPARACVFGPGGAVITNIVGAGGPQILVGVSGNIQYSQLVLGECPSAPFWLPSGWSLGGFSSSTTGGPTINAVAWITKLAV